MLRHPLAELQEAYTLLVSENYIVDAAAHMLYLVKVCGDFASEGLWDKWAACLSLRVISKFDVSAPTFGGCVPPATLKESLVFFWQHWGDAVVTDGLLGAAQHPGDKYEKIEAPARAFLRCGTRTRPVSYTHLTLPTNREV